MAAPTRFGKYELVARLGSGERYRARVVGDARQVVVAKTDAPPAQHPPHPNLAQMIDFSAVDGEAYVVWEYADGRPLDEVLARAKQLPVALSVYAVIEVLKGLGHAHAHGLVHGEVSLKNVILGFEGEVKLVGLGAAKLETARGDVHAAGVVLRTLLDGGEVPPPIAALVKREVSSVDELLEPLARWLEAQSPNVTPEVLRELMGNLFDAELLADGRLFVSHPAARAKLLALRPASAEQPQPPAPPPAAPRRRIQALAVVGILVSIAGVAVGTVFHAPALLASPEKDVLAAQPLPAPKAPPPKVEAVAAPPRVDSPRVKAPEVAFDAEAAPVTIRLTEAHQLVVPQRNCVPAERKWVLAPDRSPRVLPTPTHAPKTMGWAGPGRFNQPAPQPSFPSERTLAMLGLFVPSSGAVQTWPLDRSVSGAGPGQLCAFSLSDRSLEQESQPGSFKVNGVRKKLPRTLINVEPDDRFAVRAFAPGKKWVVRVSDISPPWPVLVVNEGRDVLYVLDHHETYLDTPVSAWLTVPVLEHEGPYSREVAIQLAPGEKLTESASDLEQRARVAFEARNVGEAARVLDRCINAYPAYPPCHRLLGDAFLQGGYRDEARAQYGEFLRLAPTHPDADEVRKLFAAP